MRRPLLCASLLAAALLTAPAQVQVRAQSVIKEVLIVHGGPEAFPGTSVFDESLRAVLLADPALQVDSHSDTSRTRNLAKRPSRRCWNTFGSSSRIAVPIW